MARLFLHLLLIVAACAPLALLVNDIALRYPSEIPLKEIGLVDAAFLVAALILPLVVLPRLGVAWRSDPRD